jgi:hypothetical protein
VADRGAGTGIKITGGFTGGTMPTDFLEIDYLEMGSGSCNNFSAV